MVIDNDALGSCSKVKAVVDANSSRKCRGRPTKVRHFHEDIDPTHFCMVPLALEFDLMSILNDFHKHMRNVTQEIVLRENTGGNWKVKLRDDNERLAIDLGWVGFTIAHKLQIGYFLTFKVLTGDSFKVIVLDLSGTEVVVRCGQHDP